MIPRKVAYDLKLLFFNTKSINFKGECPFWKKIIFAHAIHKFRFLNTIQFVYLLSIKFRFNDAWTIIRFGG